MFKSTSAHFGYWCHNMVKGTIKTTSTSRQRKCYTIHDMTNCMHFKLCLSAPSRLNRDTTFCCQHARLTCLKQMATSNSNTTHIEE